MNLSKDGYGNCEYIHVTISITCEEEMGVKYASNGQLYRVNFNEIIIRIGTSANEVFGSVGLLTG